MISQYENIATEIVSQNLSPGALNGDSPITMHMLFFRLHQTASRDSSVDSEEGGLQVPPRVRCDHSVWDSASEWEDARQSATLLIKAWVPTTFRVYKLQLKVRHLEDRQRKPSGWNIFSMSLLWVFLLASLKNSTCFKTGKELVFLSIHFSDRKTQDPGRLMGLSKVWTLANGVKPQVLNFVPRVKLMCPNPQLFRFFLSFWLYLPFLSCFSFSLQGSVYIINKNFNIIRINRKTASLTNIERALLKTNTKKAKQWSLIPAPWCWKPTWDLSLQPALFGLVNTVKDPTVGSPFH